MNKRMLFSVFIFLFSVFISSISQIILKQSTKKTYQNKIKEYLNIDVIVAYFIFFLSSLITVYSYKNVPLSFGPAIEASGYVFICFFDKIFMKEKVRKQKFFGILFIVFGIFIVCLG